MFYVKMKPKNNNYCTGLNLIIKKEKVIYTLNIFCFDNIIVKLCIQYIQFYIFTLNDFSFQKYYLIFKHRAFFIIVGYILLKQ